MADPENQDQDYVDSTTEVALKSLNPALFRNILSKLNLEAPAESTDEQLHELLGMLTPYKEAFPSDDMDNIIAIFENGTFVNLRSVETERTMFKTDSDYPCCVCLQEVVDGTGTWGYGLQCCKCSTWFHNNCMREPLSTELYSQLSNTPSFVQLKCPICVTADKQLAELLSVFTDAQIKAANAISDLCIKVATLETSLSDQVEVIKTMHKSQSILSGQLSSGLAAANILKTDFADKVSDLDTILGKIEYHLPATHVVVASNDTSPPNPPQGNIQSINTSLSVVIAGNTSISSKIDELSKTVDKLPTGINSVLNWENKEAKYQNKKKKATHPEINSTNLTTSPHAQNSNSPSPATKSPTTPRLVPEKVRSRCDDSKTVLIENITDINKTRGSPTIMCEFSKLFNLMTIKNCFSTVRGNVMIEFLTERDAVKVVNNWKPEYWSTSPSEGGTSATRYIDRSAQGIIQHVSKSITDDDLNHALEGQYPGSTARRFKNQHGVLNTVLLNFKTNDQMKAALKKGTLEVGGYLRFPIKKFIPKQTVIQCFKCFKFNHVQKVCRSKHNNCRFCSRAHSGEIQCKAETSKTYHCINCVGDNRKQDGHAATDKECPIFKERLSQINRNHHD